MRDYIGKIFKTSHSLLSGQTADLVLALTGINASGEVLLAVVEPGVTADKDGAAVKLMASDFISSDIKGSWQLYIDKVFTLSHKLLTKELAQLATGKVDEILRLRIDNIVTDFYEICHKPKPFMAGKTKINYSGRVYDDKEIKNLVNASLDFWLTAGPYSERLENKLSSYFTVPAVYLVNSGSSANLVMVSALKSRNLKAPLVAGDEIITPAVTFPTTLAPIIQNGFVPVFVDCEMGTYNIDPKKLEQAVSGKTRAIFLPHTLGNPVNMDEVMAIAKRYNLYVLEDVCDALGAEWRGKLVGTFGNMASLSFYAAHHITMGEGGAVVVNDDKFSKITLSLRDWGRDCWCKPGQNNSCGKRFQGKYGTLPDGYDHKYVYSHIGYNLKMTDLQASIGLAQFEKLTGFAKAREVNFEFYYDNLQDMQDKIILPKWENKAKPSWFVFPITVRDGVDINNIIGKLESSGIETRKIFAGNILRQPGFMGIKHRISGNLKNTDMIMRNTFFIGVYPGLTEEKKEYVLSRLRQVLKGE